MKHFYKNIKGYMKDSNIVLFDTVIETVNDNFTWVELGSWTGKSAAYCVVELIKTNKKFNFYAVDTWQGAEEHQELEIVKQDLLYDTYLKNISPIQKYITNYREFSFDAANRFADNSIDFCYVDADHSYEGVKKDLKSWWPKIRSGCYFAGDDYTKGWPGVQKAVQEFFNEKDIKVKKIGRCWCVKKP